MKEEVCEYGHICTSDCQNTKDCPCVNDHWCSMSEEHTKEECEEMCVVHGKL